MPPHSRAVIRFEPDGYDVSSSWLMGRQVAGHGFLRAYLAARAEGPVYCHSPFRESAVAFARMVGALDPQAEARWIKASMSGEVEGAAGLLYLADPTITEFARARQRFGIDRYSLCGVTHTTATAGAMRHIADLLSEPVAPWDALVCTSAAVAQTVQRIHEAEADYLKWRFGPHIRLTLPQLPVIPLGVHGADFVFSETDRLTARTALGLEPDEIAALFVGRLTFTGKHHPFAMYRAIAEVAERTGKRLVLILCGWAANDAIATAFTDGAAKFAPGVRTLTVDGREDVARRRAWASGDLFVSMTDGIQETFGLTPIEAMAAGLPCIVSDWNGYKDTVRDGVDGFRIRTWAPEHGPAGNGIAREHEAGETNYDGYLWAAAAATSVDLAQLTACLADLVQQPALRRRMGEAARARAREIFDWSVVIRQYHELWGELAARRTHGRQAGALAGAPRVASSGLSPFDAFGHYPTNRISSETMLSATLETSPEVYRDRRAHILFAGIKLPDPVAEAMLACLLAGPTRVAGAARAMGINPDQAVYVAGVLAKMGLIRLGPTNVDPH